MNILIYYEQFSLGGVDKHLYELVSNWPNKHDHLTIITNKGNLGFKKIKKNFSKFPIKIIYFNSWSYSLISNFFNRKKLSQLNYITSFLQPIFLMITVLKFIFLLKNLNKDTIILSSNGSYPGSWANVAIIFAAKILKIKKRIMLVHHEALAPRRLMKYYYNSIDKLLSNSLTNLICVSKATLNTIKKRRNLKFTNFQTDIIHNDFKIKSDNLKIKLFSKIKKKYVLFGIVGRVELYKGHEDVIRSLAHIDVSLRKRIKLLIVGSYDLKTINYLKNLALELNVKNNIIFTGYISGKSENIIKNLDVVIMATRDFEGFGYTVLEAIKLGKPLITTDVGAIGEFVNPNFVEIIKPQKIKKLALAIKKIIKDLKFYKNKAQLYKKKFPKDFVMSKLFRQIFSSN